MLRAFDVTGCGLQELEILSNSEKLISCEPAQLQLLKSQQQQLAGMQPLLVPSTTYLSTPHLPLLPTPPLDTASPTITAAPTKYGECGEGAGEGAGQGYTGQQDQHRATLKMAGREGESKRQDRRRELQPY